MNEARELVTQGNILGDEICAILENGGDDGENQWEPEGHPAHYSHSRNEPKSPQLPRSAQQCAIMTRDSSHEIEQSPHGARLCVIPKLSMSPILGSGLRYYRGLDGQREEGRSLVFSRWSGIENPQPFAFAGTLHEVEIQLVSKRDPAAAEAEARPEMSRQ
jgi:hypothetical protein